MLRKWMLTGGLLVAVLLRVAVLPVSATPGVSLSAQEEGPNLLKNPGFEEGFYYYQNVGELKLANGWEAWFVDEGEVEPAWRNRRPEYNLCTEPIRVHGGYKSQQYGIIYATHLAGILQRVEGITPGSRLRFTIWGYMYAEGNHPGNVHMKVGIDPTGGRDPFAGQVVWSPEASPLAHGKGSAAAWYQFSVEAVAQAGAVTVFAYSNPEWAAYQLGAQWDDASLNVIAPAETPTPTPLPPPPPPTYGPSPTPRPTPTPRPDGAVVHIVESGDTVFGIALMYNVPADRIRTLNASSLGTNDMIWPGQALVISIPSQTPTPTPLPAPPAAEPTPASMAEAGGGGAGGTSICVLAYHDRNGDTFRDEATEELLPNAEFTIADASGVIGRYTSNGVSEPYCFTGLVPGAYRVIQASPPGYAPSGPAEWAVPLVEGTSLDIQFGNARSEGSETPSEAAVPAPASGSGHEPSGGSSVFDRVFATVAKVSGILVLILAAGVAVLFFVNRQRM
ncbi:MAG: LysM peptidoglycan-binding domain-containing protein [Anaerolineae bacterium]